MSWFSKVAWKEGLFLQPHHFQQSDRYFEKLLEARKKGEVARSVGRDDADGGPRGVDLTAGDPRPDSERARRTQFATLAFSAYSGPQRSSMKLMMSATSSSAFASRALRSSRSCSA